MMFTDQKPFTVTAKDMALPWDGKRDGSRFRCHLCGVHFKEGDTVRWVACRRTINFMTCVSCDGDDVRERFEDLWRRPW